jgi:putative ABC transport system permease protein
MNGLARASIRFRPASFVGTFVALVVASTVVMACASMLQTGVTAEVQPVRYADAPIVVAADQFARRVVGRGEDREEVTTALPEGARLDAALAERIAAVPGVAQVIPDFAVSLGGDGVRAVTGHDWSTTALRTDGAELLVDGGAPGDGEVVVDQATAQTAGLGVGEVVSFVAPDGAHRFHLSGLAATPAPTAAGSLGADTGTAWFADGVAASLADHPGRADAIAVFTADGVDAAELAAELRERLGPDVMVRTGAGRGDVEAPDILEARELLIAIGGSFGGMATFVAVFVVLSTVALAIGQRRRELALLRAIGATPKQIRRMVASEALLVAPIAGAVGILPGVFLARWWFDQLVDRGAVPHGVEFSTGSIPAAVAIGAGLLAALAGGYAAARRPARTRPSQALGEAAVERRRLGIIRSVLGAAAFGGGVALAIVSFEANGDDAAMASLGVVMTFLTAIALLGPVIASTATTVLGLPLRRGGAAGSLAAANSRANTRRLASAITPITLVIGSSSVLLFIQSTIADATTSDIRHGVVADYVVTASGPGLPAGVDEQARDVPGVDSAVAVLRSDVLYHAYGDIEVAGAIGVTGDPSRLGDVLDLGVSEGSLAELGDGTVALDRLLAGTMDADVGDTVELRLGDGTRISPRVVAVYDRGLGLGQVLLPRHVLAPHVQAAYDSQVLVSVTDGASASAVEDGLRALGVPGASVADRHGYAARADDDLAVDAWANRVMVAVFGGFAAVAAVNTLVMVVLDRRREVALLRLTGTTRRQIRAMFRWEAAIVATTGIGLGAAISWITLIGFASGATGGTPYVPPAQALGIVGVTAALAFGAMAVPSRRLMSRHSRAGSE